jgi:hypothetical protein
MEIREADIVFFFFLLFQTGFFKKSYAIIIYIWVLKSHVDKWKDKKME